MFPLSSHSSTQPRPAISQHSTNNKSQLPQNVCYYLLSAPTSLRNPDNINYGVPSESAPHAVVSSSQQCLTTRKTDLAAQHGLPTNLPSLPSLAPHFVNQTQQQPTSISPPNPVSTIAVLPPSQVTSLNNMPPSPQPEPPAAFAEAPLDLELMLEEIVQDSSPSFKDLSSHSDMVQPAFPAYSNAFEQQQFLTSPLFNDSDFDPTSPLFRSNILGDFDTSPLLTDGDCFGTSPLLVDSGFHFPSYDQPPTTPALVMDSSPLITDSHSPQLNTPANAVGVIDSPLLADGSFFAPDTLNCAFGLGSMCVKPTATHIDGSNKEMYNTSFAPQVNMTHTPPVQIPTHSEPQPQPSLARPPPRKQNRRVIATGTRKNLKPSSLLSADAPTQTRKYTLPSATSRKEMPVTFARKRAVTATSIPAAIDDDDFLPDLPPNATEKEQIEWKRRQNTIAARKSRKRKLEHQQQLEGEVERLKRSRDMWKTRASTLKSVLKAKGEELDEDWDETSE